MLVNFLQIDISLSQSAYDLEFESDGRLSFLPVILERTGIESISCLHPCTFKKQIYLTVTVPNLYLELTLVFKIF